MSHAHDHGLQADLDTLRRQGAERRRALRWLAGAGLGAASLWLPGCGGGGDADAASDSDTSDGSGSDDSDTDTDSASCTRIPEETAGPYPGDGSNSAGGGVANALMLSGIVRADIRSSIDGADGTADGVPLTVTLKLVNTNDSCAPLEGHAVYLWHCDAEGRYSMYSSGITDENYLRGVQTSDADGELSFTTIVPGCYAGRWPHMHFEIYRSASTATSYSNRLYTSQLALPEDVCDAVYALGTYGSSAGNLAQLSLASDNVFGEDAAELQLASVSGSVAAGFAATLEVGLPL